MIGAARERIFLYGTLRRGGSRDVLKFYGGVEFIGPARVRGELHDLGDYPGLRLAAGETWVRGELFAVTSETLVQLDEWEGIAPEAPAAGEYRRLRVMAESDAGDGSECWIYEISPTASHGRPVIAAGDWIAYRASRP